MAKFTSEEYQLIKQDIVKWAKNILVFSGPAIVIGLTALQAGDAKIAAVAFGQALYSAVVDLLKKYLQETKYV